MDVRIGVTHTAKELDVELPEELDHDAAKATVESALADGRVLWLTDRKGREIGVPGDKIAYVDIGSSESAHRIGFSSYAAS